jgi:hypothetical protein
MHQYAKIQMDLFQSIACIGSEETWSWGIYIKLFERKDHQELQSYFEQPM